MTPVRSKVVAALLAVALLSTAGCVPLRDGPLEVVAEFDDSAGLFVGNDVGVLGVPVGEVTKITPRGKVVEVRLELSEDVDVPANVGAVVVARSVATDRYVELTPAFGPGKRLAEGARIPVSRTRTPVEFDEVLASLRDFSTGIAGKGGDAKALEGLLAAGAEALKGRGADANATVKELSAAAEALSGHRGDLVGTIDGLDDLTTLVARNRGVVDEFITSVADATDLFADERDNFGGSLLALSKALRSLATFVKTHRVQLRGSLKGLTKVTRSLLTHQEALAEAVEVSPLTFRNIGDAIGSDDRLDVKMPIEHLSPAPEVTGEVCAALPFVCAELGTDPDVGDLFGGLLGAVLGGTR